MRFPKGRKREGGNHPRLELRKTWEVLGLEENHTTPSKSWEEIVFNLGKLLCLATLTSRRKSRLRTNGQRLPDFPRSLSGNVEDVLLQTKGEGRKRKVSDPVRGGKARSRMLVKEPLVLAAGPQAQEYTAWGRELAWWRLQEKRKQNSPFVQ